MTTPASTPAIDRPRMKRDRRGVLRRADWPGAVNRGVPALQRFMEKVRLEGDCLIWTAGTFEQGYGAFQAVSRNTWRAHTWAWVNIGEQPRPPRGMELHHTCEHKLCVNWRHLVVLTRKQHAEIHGNSSNAKKTHCNAGHPLSGDNLWIERGKDGYTKRRCKRCRADRLAEFYARKREAAA